WQCKKQTVVANSTIEAKYVAASSYCGQVIWIQNQLLDYGDSNEKKLIQLIKIHSDKNVTDLLTKAFDVTDLNRIRVNAADSKLMLLGINLLLLLKVNVARHNLLLLLKVNVVRHNLQQLVNINAVEGSFINTSIQSMDMSNITSIQSKKRTRERMSDQEAKEIKAEAREIMPQPSTKSNYSSHTKVKTVNGERQLQALVDKKKLGDMSHHKKTYVNPSHTKKIFANMKREGKDFLGRVTPMFAIMMVQANQEEGADLAIPIDSQQTPIISQPSSSKPQKKKSRRKQRKDRCPIDSRVLALETTKSNQALEIESLKRRVKSLEKRRKSRTPGFKRLRKVGSASRVESSNDSSLGAQEDASK
ncbi:hypothetical protein Tco_0545697, partial [Tanacetum coccineum]